VSNVVVISGKISDYGVKIRPLPSGKWELNFTLCCDEPGRDGQVYTTYVPVLVYGAQCEPLAESLEPHDVVLVTGKLAWTKKTTKDGEKSGLAVTTFNVEVLHKIETAAGVTADLQPGPDPEPTSEPPAKPRKRALQKHLQRQWVPSGLVSSDN
jgi:single-stranded DNA-binding protein